jgi:hypothetical protein
MLTGYDVTHQTNILLCSVPVYSLCPIFCPLSVQRSGYVQYFTILFYIFAFANLEVAIFLSHILFSFCIDSYVGGNLKRRLPFIV